MSTTLPATSTTTIAETTTTTVARPRRLADGHVTRPMVFPVVGGSWLGSGWNDCRGANCERYHHGVDIIANLHQAIVSPVDGRVTELIRNHPSVGWGVVIVDADGYRYDLYHLPADPDWRFAGGLDVGDSVSAGQLIGFVGGSGNANGYEHVHFELRRPNGVQISPYWSLTAAATDALLCAPAADVDDSWDHVSGAVVDSDHTEFRASDESACVATGSKVFEML